MLELESIHIDPLSYDVKPRGDSQRLDLENAVLMQELMAMKVPPWAGPSPEPCSHSPHSHREEAPEAPANGSAADKKPAPLMLHRLSPKEGQSLICRQGQFQRVRGHSGWMSSWRHELNSGERPRCPALGHFILQE